MASYELDKDGQSLTSRCSSRRRTTSTSTPNTRFWQASGIDVSLTASGLSVQTQSVLSILIGGIAFETPASDPASPAAEANTDFTLFSDRDRRLQAAAAQSAELRARLQGLGARARRPARRSSSAASRSARSSDIHAQVDAKTFEFSAPVTILLDAQRLGVKIVDLPPGADFETTRAEADREPGRARGARAAADREPADRRAVRRLRLLPRRAAGDGGLVAEAGAAADRSGRSWRRSRRASSASSRSSTRCRSRRIGDDVRKAIVELDRTLVTARGTLDKRTRHAGRQRRQADRAELRARRASSATRCRR